MEEYLAINLLLKWFLLKAPHDSECLRPLEAADGPARAGSHGQQRAGMLFVVCATATKTLT